MTNEQSGVALVAVIIPARNAEETISATLDSLLNQSFQDWEAIVVDDGSTDRTAAIANGYTRLDSRFTLREGPARGVSAARNVGLAASAAPLILFLDADDMLQPDMIDRMVGALESDPTADAVHCGWIFTDWNGSTIGSKRCEIVGPDLFPVFSKYCAFAIHTCVIRRTQLNKAGWFDESLRTCEDFDIWQRVARIGTRFTAIQDALSIYRLRPTATWFDSSAFLQDALVVVRRGHQPDLRIADDLVPPAHRGGAPASELPTVELQMITWAAAAAIARGVHPPLYDLVTFRAGQTIDPAQIANTLFQALPLTLCRPQADWKDLWQGHQRSIRNFLEDLAKRSGELDLAERVQRALEKQILDLLTARLEPQDCGPVIIGSTAAFALDASRPIPDLILSGAERALCAVRFGEQQLGSVLVPVADGTLSSFVLSDIIAGRFAWQLLRLFFERHVYPGLVVAKDAEGWTIVRGDIILQRCSSDPTDDLHDRVGWVIFLQELLARPEDGIEALYDPKNVHGDEPRRAAAAINRIELSETIPSIRGVSDKTCDVQATIGGVQCVVARVPAVGGIVSSAEIRFAILDRGKMELARAAVREALIGRPLEQSRSLRQRLQAAAKLRMNSDCDVVPRTRGSTLIIRSPAAIHSSEAGRRLALPISTSGLLAAAADGQSLLIGQGEVGQVYFVPELMAALEESRSQANETGRWRTTNRYGRHHFESLFASGSDPWQYTSAYEQRKYEQTLSLLPEGHRDRVLEIGCAEGHFTAQLLPLVRSLVASDISTVALRRTAERCAGFDNLALMQFDLTKEPLEGPFDLIICSEVLYYMGDRDDLLQVGRKLARALKRGGYLIAAHANLVVDDPTATGFDWAMPYGAKTIGQTLATTGSLIFEEELNTSLYRIQRFRRSQIPALLRVRGSDEARKVKSADYALPEPVVANHILWSGGTTAAVSPWATTDRLPILMYHHVANKGPDHLARWRTEPVMFAAQMRYLKDAGFTTTTFGEWQLARREGKPLPGRKVIITFDDGYADFEEHALPILRGCGFGATIFLPTDHVGGSARWDARHGEPLPLLDWDAARRLRDNGMMIGAHSRSHRHLTTLNFVDLVEELAGARTVLERELETRVDAVAYPFGDYDESVLRTAAACGFIHGVTTRPGFSEMRDEDLALSRVEVMGHHALEDFIVNLG